jgi:anti-sigma regulatory factor (Ser/Thr protein kinase)
LPNIIRIHYEIDGGNFTVAGEASSDVKRKLKQLGVEPELIRKVAISMYEGEINTVIHGGGGAADVEIHADRIIITLSDKGPGVADVEKAMQEGFSTATDEARALGFGAGMGLPNMKKYSDEMSIESVLGEGTTVTLVVYLTAKG